MIKLTGNLPNDRSSPISTAFSKMGKPLFSILHDYSQRTSIPNSVRNSSANRSFIKPTKLPKEPNKFIDSATPTNQLKSECIYPLTAKSQPKIIKIQNTEATNANDLLRECSDTLLLLNNNYQINRGTIRYIEDITKTHMNDAQYRSKIKLKLSESNKNIDEIGDIVEYYVSTINKFLSNKSVSAFTIKSNQSEEKTSRFIKDNTASKILKCSKILSVLPQIKNEINSYNEIAIKEKFQIELQQQIETLAKRNSFLMDKLSDATLKITQAHDEITKCRSQVAHYQLQESIVEYKHKGDKINDVQNYAKLEDFTLKIASLRDELSKEKLYSQERESSANELIKSLTSELQVYKKENMKLREEGTEKESIILQYNDYILQNECDKTPSSNKSIINCFSEILDTLQMRANNQAKLEAIKQQLGAQIFSKLESNINKLLAYQAKILADKDATSNKYNNAVGSMQRLVNVMTQIIDAIKYENVPEKKRECALIKARIIQNQESIEKGMKFIFNETSINNVSESSAPKYSTTIV